MHDQDRLKLFELRKEIISLGAAVIQLRVILQAIQQDQPQARIQAADAELGRRIDSFLHELSSDSFNG